MIVFPHLCDIVALAHCPDPEFRVERRRMGIFCRSSS